MLLDGPLPSAISHYLGLINCLDLAGSVNSGQIPTAVVRASKQGESKSSDRYSVTGDTPRSSAPPRNRPLGVRRLRRQEWVVTSVPVAEAFSAKHPLSAANRCQRLLRPELVCSNESKPIWPLEQSYVTEKLSYLSVNGSVSAPGSRQRVAARFGIVRYAFRPVPWRGALGFGFGTAAIGLAMVASDQFQFKEVLPR